MFFGWAVSRGWHEKVRFNKQRPRALEKWAVYLENIAGDFSQDSKRAALLRQAADKRLDLDQPEKAMVDLEKALGIDAEDDSSKAKLIRIYYDVGRRAEAVRLAKERIDQGHSDWDTISVLLEDVFEHPAPEPRSFLEQFLRTGHIPGRRVLAAGRIITVGLTLDSWTVDGRPGYLLIHGLPNKPLVQTVGLTCYADSKTLPLTVTIDSGVKKINYTFHRPEQTRISLPEIPPGGTSLFMIRTDKSWVPKGSGDTRSLGVRVVLQGDGGEAT